MPTTTPFLVLLGILVTSIAADCCHSDDFHYCADGPETLWNCCGVGPCNIFCCNCDGGCRQPSFAGCLFFAQEFYYNCLGEYGPSCAADHPETCAPPGTPSRVCWAQYMAKTGTCYINWNQLIQGALWADPVTPVTVPILTVDDCLVSALNNHTSCMYQPISLDPVTGEYSYAWSDTAMMVECDYKLGVANASCQSHPFNDTAVNNVRRQGSVARREPQVRTHSPCGTEVLDPFGYADVDKSGGMSLEEYLKVINATREWQLTSWLRVKPWVKRFVRFDVDQDGMVNADEAFAVVNLGRD